MIQAQSYGGGVQSVALAVLNATGRIPDPTRLVIFADPGSEEPGTYKHLGIMRPWLQEHRMELVTVRTHRNQSLPLYDFVMERSTPIPVRSSRGGLGRRQCTQNWKVDAIKGELRQRGATEAVVQIGISLDEIHRMKDSPTKWIGHRFPLVDLRVTRDDCRRIIEAEGLPVPPKSRCFFCPLQRVGDWQRKASEQPELFEASARLEDRIIERAHGKGRPPAFLSSRLKPLRQAFSTEQLAMRMDGAGEEDEMCGGYCFT